MRDRRGRSEPPRPLGASLPRALEGVAPKTPLAEVQALWPKVVGPQISRVTKVVDEREGTIVVECENSVWAQELEMMGTQLLADVASRMTDAVPDRLRFIVAR
jgi:predicted nucleic acid-binding Zn ribbon protein